MNPRDQLALNVRRRRERLGLSQEALGERCSLHRTEISLIERAGRDVRLSTLVKVARALDATPAQLLRGVR